MSKRKRIKRKVKAKVRKVKQEVKDFTNEQGRVIFFSLILGGILISWAIMRWLGIPVK